VSLLCFWVRGDATEIVHFSKVAPYLVNPLVLVGFCVFLLFGIYQALLKAGFLAKLSQRQSSAVLRLLLNHGFLVAIVIIVLGFVYAGFQAYHDASREHLQQGPITQQTGPCGSNIVGDNNKASVDCADKAQKTK
jgi:hypothetical protein